MSEDNSVIIEKEFIYPTPHWIELEQFVFGKKLDPKGCFRLSDDRWDLSSYADDFFPTEKFKYIIRFDKLQSFLKPYVKSYCYRQLIGNRVRINSNFITLPSGLHPADQYFIDNNMNSLDDISSQEAFMKLWEAQAIIMDDKGNLSIKDWRQRQTRPFWRYLTIQFDIPIYIPQFMSKNRSHPTTIAADKSKIIPREVIIQLSNKLALHRDKKVLLNRFNHLRLCVLMLTICTGRRINEILKASRHTGPLGPLLRLPTHVNSEKGTLFFIFRPLKGGREKLVCISPQWEDIVEYCVREIILYSDEVREMAATEERDLLILISTWNRTKGSQARLLQATSNKYTFCKKQNLATLLTYGHFLFWLRGGNKSRYYTGAYSKGIMEEWNITRDGSPNGEIYKLQPSHARHSRQTALAKDPDIPMSVKQHDLNHTDPNDQFYYQHSLSEDKETLMRKLRGGELLGNGVNWLLRTVSADRFTVATSEGFRQGMPSILDERWQRLVNNHPVFIQFNRTTCGYCISPTGVSGCTYYTNCTEAADGGCNSFVTDPADKRLMSNIQERALQHRARQQESLLKGRTVQAGKHRVCAERTEDLYQRGLYQIERLKKRASTLKKN